MKTVTPISSEIMLPTACRCGSIKGTIVNDEIACEHCGAKRCKKSEATEKFLVSITEHFGEPTSIVLRKPDTLAAIAKQDEFLKRKRTPDGEPWFDIITDNIGRPASEGAGFTVDPEDIAPDPIDAGLGNETFPCVEEGEHSNDY
jgi:hypothetical protein